MRFPSAVINWIHECIVGGYHSVSRCGHDDGVAYVSTGLSADDVLVPDMSYCVQFAEEADVVVEVYSSQFLKYVRADEVRAVRKVLYLASGCGSIGSEVVVVFDVGKLVDGTGVTVCGIFQRYVDEVFGDVGVDVDGLGLQIVVGGVDGDELVESEVESGSVMLVRVFDEADKMDDIGN